MSALRAALTALVEQAREWVYYADASPDLEVFSSAWMHSTIIRRLAALDLGQPPDRAALTEDEYVLTCHVCADHARVEDLIERSSLGTAAAKATRASVSREVGIAIARAADYLGRARRAEAEVERLRAVVAAVREQVEDWREYAFHPSIPDGDWAILRADAVVSTLDVALSGDEGEVGDRG